MSRSIHKKILFDFFDGKATAIQRRHLEEWLREPSNEPLFFRCLDEWEGQHPQYFPNTDAALGKFVTLLEAPLPDPAEPPISAELNHPAVSRYWRWMAAASVLLMVAGGLFFQKQLAYKSYQTGYAQTSAFHLPDSTHVWLNANSTLWVPRWGFKDRREVLLEGEGEFKVSHTSDHKRFVVKTDHDFNVEVLGTEFVVFARPRGNKVVLNKGKVEVHYQQKQIVLSPGDALSLWADSNRPKLTKLAKPELAATWKTHQFYFDDAPISEVRLTLEEHFGLKVNIADSSLNDRRLSGYFKASCSREIVDILSALLETPIDLSGDTITIPKPIQ